MLGTSIYERHLAELRVELAQCEEQARKLRSLIVLYEDLAGGQPEPAPENDLAKPSIVSPVAAIGYGAGLVGGLTGEGVGRSAPRASPVSAKVFNETVTAILNKFGRPLSREGIRDELAKCGIVFGGKQPVTAISTKLWRSRDKFRLIPGRGYWLADSPVPSVDTSGSDNAADDAPNNKSQTLAGHPADYGAAMLN